MNVRFGLFLATGILVPLFLTACGESDSPSLFARRVEASFDVTAKVTYEITFDQDSRGNPAPMSMMLTQGPWGRRMDSYASRETKTYAGTLLDMGDEQYICSRATGFEPEGFPEGVTEAQLEALEDGVCYSGESLFDDSDEVFGPIFDFTFSFRETLIKESDEEVEWRVTSSRTIAGTNADCYQVTFTDPETSESGDADICFSYDDILLAMDVRSPDGSGAITLSALEVERDVQEDDFALPYPVVDWPY